MLTGKTKWSNAKLTAKLTTPVNMTIRQSRADACADVVSAMFAPR
jgi:hypothetical protein